MSAVSVARRVRDSRTATIAALAGVLLAQTPTLLVFRGVSMFGDSLGGVAAAWGVGALAWTSYTAVHLLAPLADIRAHPERHSWGPFQTLNVYIHLSLRQVGIRLLHGVLGFVIVLTGVVLLVSSELLLLFPAIVTVLSAFVMGAHVGVKDPSEETLEHL